MGWAGCERVATVGDRDALLEVVTARAVLRLDAPVELSSGGMSDTFVDVKRAMAAGPDLGLACRVMAAQLEAAGIAYDAVGGMTMGADQFSYGLAIVTGCGWFVVRKTPKGRGTDRRIEGTELASGTRVVVLEDTVSTGGSLLEAIDVVAQTGAEIVAAVTLVDRGEALAPVLAARGITYQPVFTYADVGIAPL